jgi:hypothetical protein
MAFKKYQSVEKTDVLSETEHKQVESNLHKLGKTSGAGLSDADRKKAFDSVASSK